jgi:putative hydrolase of the HAD superfamily
LLIIFDLDDTLIDTSGQITPFQLRASIDAMVDSGVLFNDVDQTKKNLLRLNETAQSAKHALEEFCEINQLSKKDLELALSVVYDQIPSNLSFDPHDQALEILSGLCETHKLALVTVGKEHLQMMKLKKAGIHSDLFSKIIVTQERNKKIHYQSMIDEFEVHPSEVLVCGDRIAVDLSPAKELGFKTIHMRSGRGLHCKGNQDDVDFTISHLSEILQILPQVSNITSFNG